MLLWVHYVDTACLKLLYSDILLLLAFVPMLQSQPPSESMNNLLFLHFEKNLWYSGSQLKNPDISGAIFTWSLSILILNSKFIEGARDVRVLQLTPITSMKICIYSCPNVSFIVWFFRRHIAGFNDCIIFFS